MSSSPITADAAALHAAARSMHAAAGAAEAVAARAIDVLGGSGTGVDKELVAAMHAFGGAARHASFRLAEAANHLRSVA